jgi:hypothetical protein
MFLEIGRADIASKIRAVRFRELALAADLAALGRIVDTSMKCPNCGERRVLITSEVPGASVPAFKPVVHRC